MIDADLSEDDPFAPLPPDEAAELDALARALQLAQGFTLLIACCNRGDHRDRLMDDLQARLPQLRVQRLALRQAIPNLLSILRERIDTPPPDAVFVSGLEAWLPSGEEAENAPFVLNLNAARNYFPRDVPCPLVLWLPQHLLVAIAHGAPDFCSVRSGLYSFAATPQAREWVTEVLTSPDHTAMAGLAYDEKFERIAALTEMLGEFESLPPELRDPLAEARLLNSLAALHQVLGNYAVALPLYQRSLRIREDILGPEHPDTATSLNNLAWLHQDQGQYAVAEALCRRALAIRERVLGPDHPDTASTLNNLAALFREHGRYTESESLFQRVLAIKEKALGPEHPDTATSLNNLAGLYRSQGQYVAAVPLYRRALAIREKALGPEHPDTATSLNNLALLYASQGQYAAAEPLYRRALEITEKALGPEHPDMATSLNNVAGFYDSQGQYAAAEPLFRRALAIQEKVLGPEHPDLATTLENYASLLRRIVRKAEARAVEARAKAIRAAHASHATR
jgi:tetratricopeptide (TPR) repeat protein